MNTLKSSINQVHGAFGRWRASLLNSGDRTIYTRSADAEAQRTHAAKVLHDHTHQPEQMWMRLVRTNGQRYVVVFRDASYQMVTDVWHMTPRRGVQRECVWAHVWNTHPSPRVLNICKRAYEVVLQETIEAEKRKPKGERVQPSPEHPPAPLSSSDVSPPDTEQTSSLETSTVSSAHAAGAGSVD